MNEVISRVFRGFKSLSQPFALSAVMLAGLITDLPAGEPKIELSHTTFDFGKVKAGEIIQHTFSFTNTGDQVLEIKDVRPSCGCTTAGTWEHEIQPGKIGSIPIRFNSTEYTGPIHKTVIIICNDPSETNLVLHIQGTIWRPIELTPESATFVSSSDNPTNEIKLVRILNNLDQALVVSEPECTNSAFQTSLKTVRPGKEFELAIRLATQSKPLSILAPITLKTSSTNVPLLTVMARALVQAPVTAMPSTITLPGRPLVDSQEFNVTIRNNGFRPLALSDPSILADLSPAVEPIVSSSGTDTHSAAGALAPVPGAEARIKEVQSGRMFILAASFPTGFQVAPRQTIELRVKTNHPQFPVIKIPVVQGQSLDATLAPSPSAIYPSTKAVIQ